MKPITTLSQKLKSKPKDFRLFVEIAIVLILKIIVIMVIWQCFFAGNKVKVNPEIVSDHLLGSPQQNQ